MTAFLQAWRTSNWAVMYAHAGRGGPGAGIGGGLPDAARRLPASCAASPTWPGRSAILSASSCRRPRARRICRRPPLRRSHAGSIGQSDADRHAEPTPLGTPPPPDTPLDGPRLGLQAAMALDVTTELFGDVELDRELVLAASRMAGRCAGSRSCCSRSSATEGRSPAAPRGAGARQHRRPGRDGLRAHARRRRARLSAGVAGRPDDRLCHPGDGGRPARRCAAGATGSATWSAAAGSSRGPRTLLRGTPGSSCRRCRPRAIRWRCCGRDDGPRRRPHDHDPARPPGDRRAVHRRLQRGRHRRGRPAQRRRLGARIGSRSSTRTP